MTTSSTIRAPTAAAAAEEERNLLFDPTQQTHPSPSNSDSSDSSDSGNEEGLFNKAKTEFLERARAGFVIAGLNAKNCLPTDLAIKKFLRLKDNDIVAAVNAFVDREKNEDLSTSSSDDTSEASSTRNSLCRLPPVIPPPMDISIDEQSLVEPVSLIGSTNVASIESLYADQSKISIDKQFAFIVMVMPSIVNDWKAEETEPYKTLLQSRKKIKGWGVSKFKPTKAMAVLELKRRDPKLKINGSNTGLDVLVKNIAAKTITNEEDIKFVKLEESKFSGAVQTMLDALCMDSEIPGRLAEIDRLRFIISIDLMMSSSW